MSANLQIRKVAVLGAGVMGAQIAAHLVNANVETLLFELPAKEGDPNGNVNKALDGLRKLDPAPISSPSRITYIQPANYEQHLELLRDCDLIIEAIAERIDWKSDLYRKVAPFVNADAIFATNTSGLSINTLAEAFPEQLRHRFCGVHFFNPPRYMHLVELIPCKGTEASLLDHLEEFLVSTLGKGVVRAKDTPNFIANRIGVFSMLATKHHAAAFNLGFDMVDALTGRYLGRPKSATFRTLDVVGLDVFAHVVNTMRENLTEDPWHKHFELPAWFQYLVDQGSLGQKTKRGIYQKIGKEIHVLDLHTREYRLSDAKVDDGVKDILRERDWAKKLAGLRANPHPQAQFLWAVFRDAFHYCALHLDAIANNARDLDFAVRWGFGWDSGPFEIWQAAGWQKSCGLDCRRYRCGQGDGVDTVTPMGYRTGPHWGAQHAGFILCCEQDLPAAFHVTRLSAPIFPDRCSAKSATTARPYSKPTTCACGTRRQHRHPEFQEQDAHHQQRSAGRHLRAVDEAEAHFSALILWQTEPPFSVGANLLQMMQGLQETPEAGMFGKLKGAVNRVKFTAAGGGSMGDMFNAATGNVPKVEAGIAKFQQTSMRLKYAQVPTIAAVDGLALGGGCEFSIHCSRIVATLESYIGLVEVGVGLLPAGGGCKEMAQRASQEALRYSSDNRVDIFPFVRRYFQNIAMGEVAKSAELAREMGYLRRSDRIVLNRFELLHVAKEEAKAMNATAWRPPLHQRQIAVAGRTGIATLKAAMLNMREGGFISEHDYNIGCRVAETLCGGDVEAGSMVDEQWLLDLERKNFMELLATEKTQARIEHMLKNGKPLRN